MRKTYCSECGILMNINAYRGLDRDLMEGYKSIYQTHAPVMCATHANQFTKQKKLRSQKTIYRGYVVYEKFGRYYPYWNGTHSFSNLESAKQFINEVIELRSEMRKEWNKRVVSK